MLLRGCPSSTIFGMPKINWPGVAYSMAGIAMSVGLIVWEAWIKEHTGWVMWPLIASTVFCFFMAAREAEWFRVLWASVVPRPGQTVLKGSESFSVSAERVLKESVLQLGRDLFAFAREKGPEPGGPRPESGDTLDDRFRWLSSPEMQQRRSTIIHGYELRFKQRTRDIYNELREKNLQYEGIGDLGAIRQVSDIDQIEKIARACFNVAKEMDIAEEKKKS